MMTLSVSGLLAPTTAHRLPLLSRAVLSVALTLINWQIRRSTRRSLARLEPHLLSDIGLDAQFVASEIRKPFWRG